MNLAFLPYDFDYVVLGYLWEDKKLGLMKMFERCINFLLFNVYAVWQVSRDGQYLFTDNELFKLIKLKTHWLEEAFTTRKQMHNF